MNGKRHFPIRTCLGCGTRRPKAELLRIVRDASGRLAPDWEGRAGGRGGYIHRTAACWSEFARRKGIVRSLRVVVDRTARADLIENLQRNFGG